VCFELWYYNGSCSVLFTQDGFGCSGSLWFYRYFRIIFSSSVKNAVGILTGITLNLQISLGSMDILTMWVFPP
jgi:hypothetical protein